MELDMRLSSYKRVNLPLRDSGLTHLARFRLVDFMVHESLQRVAGILGVHFASGQESADERSSVEVVFLRGRYVGRCF